MYLFDIKQIFFTLWGYPMSYLEFFGTVAGGLAVWLSARANVWSWPLGLVNVTLFFFLFFQVQLYPDMLLQVFFFITNLMGWWRWLHPSPGEEDQKKELRVTRTNAKTLFWLGLTTLVVTACFGLVASKLHTLLPAVFSLPSAFPFLDSFVTVISIAATWLMVQKRVECWAAWLMADVIATYLYFAKGIMFVGIEYFIFCLIAAFGWWNWHQEARKYTV
ncbi:MAG: nicotinamide riboside transporter PnuC [Cyclobacteriaceae bacterium]